MFLSQICRQDEALQVVVRVGTEAYVISDCSSTYDLARDCANLGITLKQLISQLGLGAAVDVEGALAQGQVLAPIHHPDPTQMFLSAAPDPIPARRGMHAWHYRGDGRAIVTPGMPLLVNDLAPNIDAGPSVAGVYIISDIGTPFRIGFAMASDFSDRVMNTQSYAGLVQGRLRPMALGPELLLAALPHDIQGTLRLTKDDTAIADIPINAWQDDLTDTITNLERVHFACDTLCQPGQLHILMFALAQGTTARPGTGDTATLTIAGFGLPLSNVLHLADSRPDGPMHIDPL